MTAAHPHDATAFDFQSWMQHHLQAVEFALDKWVGKDAPPTLAAPMRYAVLDGGKRLRPLLVIAAAQAVDGHAAAALRAACAVELIHAYSLVHDDMPCMDNDTLRRGKPTVHVAYGEAGALLAGDALQALAFELLTPTVAHTVAPATPSAPNTPGASNAPSAPQGRLVQKSLSGEVGTEAAPPSCPAHQSVDPATQAQLCALLARASGALGMAGGQAIDLASVGQTLDEAALRHMHSLKTGALLAASVNMGAACGSPSAQARAALAEFGQHIGLAFQVVDDVLDVVADAATLGKTPGKDAAADKPTYVSLLGLPAARALATDLLDSALAALHRSALADTRALQALARMVVERSH